MCLQCVHVYYLCSSYLIYLVVRRDIANIAPSSLTLGWYPIYIHLAMTVTFRTGRTVLCKIPAARLSPCPLRSQDSLGQLP